jgi:hypothetical protein
MWSVCCLHEWLCWAGSVDFIPAYIVCGDVYSSVYMWCRIYRVLVLTAGDSSCILIRMLRYVHICCVFVVCGLVFRGPGSIFGATRFSESGTGSIQPREYN